MKKYFFLIVVISLLVQCKKDVFVSDNLLQYQPRNASIIVKVNNFQSFKSGIKNNDFIQKFKRTSWYKNLEKELLTLERIAPEGEIVFSYSELGKKELELSFATKKGTIFSSNSQNVDSIATETYENKTLETVFLKETVLYTTAFDSILVGSSSKLILENLIRTKSSLTQAPKLKKLYHAAQKNKYGTVFINTSRTDAFLETFVKNKSISKLSKLSEWFSLDIDLQQESLGFSGIATSNDSIPHYLDLFKNNSSFEQKLPKYIPISATEVNFLHISDFKTINKQRERYLEKVASKDSLFYGLEEIAKFRINQKNAVELMYYEGTGFNSFLENNQKEHSLFQKQSIVTLSNTQFLSEKLNPIIQDFTANFYTILEDAYIFTEEKTTMEIIISNYQNHATLNKEASFIYAKTALADESTLFTFLNNKGIKEALIENTGTKTAKNLNSVALENYHFASQIISDNHFFHVNLLFQKNPKTIQHNVISPIFTIKLDADILTNPQFVINHRTKKKEIVIQDVEYNLYLISTNGKVLWKKRLKGEIQGKIEQVDIYKNGKLQLAFTTSNQFLILDRNGKEVAPFNITFKGGNLNPLAVFDYEKNKNYRFVTAQGTKVKMYDNLGKIVNGFTFKTTESNLLFTPKHFRIGSKDYLVFAEENGKLHILNRRGKVRISVKTTFNFSKNPVYFYKNKFSFTTNKGELIQINTNGKISKTSLKIGKEHFIDASRKSLATIFENTFSIKGNKKELDIGVYTPPKIFYLYDKIYVSTTDIENNNTYLFDSKAQLIKNFPVYGSSVAALEDIDNDKKLELVVKNGSNTLVLYKLL